MIYLYVQKNMKILEKEHANVYKKQKKPKSLGYMFIWDHDAHHGSNCMM